jgi:hypothetical protein
VELKELNRVEYKIVVEKVTIAKAIENSYFYIGMINLYLMEKKGWLKEHK